MKPKRIRFLNVPVDNIDKESLSVYLEELLKNGGQHQIVLLSTKKLFKARRNKDYFRALNEATLVLPVSTGITKGLKFQKKGDVTRYNPYELIIRIFMAVEKMNKTAYLLGAHQDDLKEAEKNIKISFPKLKIIGRFSGYFKKDMEENVVLAIKKSAPALLFAGRGIKGAEIWLAEHKKNFNDGLCLYADNFLEVFAGREKRVSKEIFNMGLENMSGVIYKPWLLLRFFSFLYLKFLTLIYRIRKL
ncbi:MAG: WecB/TagA/CpsF family glycosyltransferase [Spirochaetales bacterium]|nr:WecB/TagA/CpsF family glycosyltransferase [Spirochaetales bacterium]